ncbi:hypothetical protein [Streptomyces celluloflavus]|uniref:hypothetical protein n=1 Tax=Streptomyces celluloflavus TaxID=58344 RepID=UPI00346140FC|nr:hypothetical protein OG717_29925 [Streptomyces celluloflavus]
MNDNPMADGQTVHVVTVLSHPGLIRLVSEIDDNGPIRHRMLGRTFADLGRHQVRHALAVSREHGLVRAGHKSRPCYLLTESGTGLADVYDQAARWARAHNYPDISSDFVTRVQDTLILLGQAPVLRAMNGAVDDMRAAGRVVDAGLLPNADAVRGLHQPWASLSRWMRAHPSLLAAAVHHSTAHDMECVA